jgi:acetyl-CoA carboxylase biotin carboxylase subunit
MFSKILIANRGEIAVRIIRACKEMGIATVAVCSEADRDTLHAALADECYCIGPAAAEDSYLNAQRILSAALVSGAQAIHPGYGFLSENARFARLCRKNGVVFIGPEADCMERLEDKAGLKTLLRTSPLRPIPGTEALSSPEEALSAAEGIGYPVMLKACCGGGGRGIRVVASPEELRREYSLAAAESEAAFGDGRVYLEKCILSARHIEVQVLADEKGNVVCLGERDCSIQRRHQKLIEESPSPAVSPEQRQRLFEQINAAVRAIGYTGVGTLEFLLDKAGNFYFMEMNVRLQVEHPVTEALTGVDLVKWQIRVASGIPLNFRQEDVHLFGSAIECRINALAPGQVEFMHVSGGPHVRFDTWMVTGTRVTPYYDSLLGKPIVYAGSREQTLRKMKAALCELVIYGVENNIEEQIHVVGSEPFMSGEYDLDYFEK